MHFILLFEFFTFNTYQKIAFFLSIKVSSSLSIFFVFSSIDCSLIFLRRITRYQWKLRNNYLLFQVYLFLNYRTQVTWAWYEILSHSWSIGRARDNYFRRFTLNNLTVRPWQSFIVSSQSSRNASSKHPSHRLLKMKK